MAWATAYSATTVFPDPVGAATSTDCAGVEGVDRPELERVEREVVPGEERLAAVPPGHSPHGHSLAGQALLAAALAADLAFDRLMRRPMMIETS